MEHGIILPNYSDAMSAVARIIQGETRLNSSAGKKQRY
jgi:hypothetical protein